MATLSETKTREVKLALTQYNYTLVYNKMSLILDHDEITLFSKPKELSNQGIKWSTDLMFDDTQIRSFDQLSDVEQYVVAEKIEKLKKPISAKLSKNPEFKVPIDDLFRVPDLASIKVIQKEENLIPVLTQWGCHPYVNFEGVDWISMVIDRIKRNTAPVVIRFFYTDGPIASNKEFWLKYLENETLYVTDTYGVYDRGECKLGSVLRVYEKLNGKEKSVHELIVTENGDYKVSFSLFAKGTVKVVDQNNNTIPNSDVIVEYDYQETIASTGATGILQLEDLPIGKPITIRDKNNPHTYRTHIIDNENNNYILKVGSDLDFVRVRLVDHRKRPIPGISIDFTYNSQTRKETTDDDGYCILPRESFIDGERVDAFIHLKK